MTLRVASILLAGGLGRRLGGPKAHLTLGGDALLPRLAERLVRASDRVLVVTRTLEASAAPALPAGVERIADDHPGEGPLTAFGSALRALATEGDSTRCDACVLCACDQPFLEAAALATLAKTLEDMPHTDAIVLQHEGRDSPFGSIWRIEPTARATEQLVAVGERRLTALADTLRHCVRIPDPASIGIPRTFLDDIDTPEELARAESIVARRRFSPNEPT